MSAPTVSVPEGQGGVALRAAEPGRDLPISASAALPAFTVVPLALLSGLLVVSAVAPGATRAAALPLAVVGMALGVPHGAVDHLVASWCPGLLPSEASRPRRVALLLLVLGYVAVAALTATALLAAGTVALPLLLALSAWHFGRGEVVAWAERASRPVPRWDSDLLPALAHGAAVVGLLLWARPRETLHTAGALAPDLRSVVTVRPVGLTVVVALVLTALVVLVRRGRVLEAAELALVAGLFATAPPLAAFGIYFAAWHSLRHTGRLLDLARRSSDATWRPAARRLLLAGALPSLAAWATMVVLWHWGQTLGPAAQVSVLLALTAPHAVVVAALDRTRGRSAQGPVTAASSRPAGSVSHQAAWPSR